MYCFTLSDEFLARHYEEKTRQRQAIQEEKRKVHKIIDYIIDQQPQMVLACTFKYCWHVQKSIFGFLFHLPLNRTKESQGSSLMLDSLEKVHP